MEAKDQAEVKESRTEKLLKKLKIDGDFGDPKLPKGFFSHSQYISWKICGQAYKFKYVDKVRTPGYPSTSKGQAVHSGVEFMLLGKRAGKVPTVEDGIEVVKTIFDKEAERVEKWDEDIPQEKIKAEAVDLFKAFTTYALPKIRPVAIEEGFAKKMGDVPMIGWIDLVDEQPAILVPTMNPEDLELAPKKLVTVDFKTGRAKWSDNELRLDTQLTMYAYVKGTPHVRVDQLLSKKKGAEYIRGESERTPQDAEIFIEDLNEVAQFIKQGVFPKTSVDNWACNEKHCSFWALCRGRKR